MRYILLFFLLTLIAAKPEISVDKYNVEFGEQLTLTIEIANSKDYPKIDLSLLQKNFKIVNGPRTKDITQINNRSVVRIKNMSWDLLPKKSGELVIPSLSVSIGNKSYKLDKITIYVGKNSKKNGNDEIFIKVEIDKDSAYLGEQITLTYKLYKRSDLNIRAIDNLRMPDFKGFWTEELYTPKQYQYQSKEVIVQGLRYQVINLGQRALFPLPSGEHTIPSLEVTVQIDAKEKRNRRDPFSDSFFDSFFGETRTRTLVTKIKKVKIKPFPDIRPKDFTGAVGEFKLSSEIDRNNIKVNEALTLNIKLTGTGNIGLFSLPSLEFPDDVEAFPPTGNLEKDGFRNQITGNQTLEYIVIPRKEGRILLPRIQMSFFNPKLNNWEQINSDLINVNIAPADEDVSSNQGFTKREIELIGEDIRYIHTDVSILENKNNHFKATQYIYIISFALFIFPFLTTKINGYRLSNEKDKKKYNALRLNLKKLKYSINQDPFEVASKSIYFYLKDKLSLPSGNLDPAKVRSILSNRIDKDICDQLFKILIICDEGKYSPILIEKKETIIDEVVKLLKIVDKELS